MTIKMNAIYATSIECGLKNQYCKKKKIVDMKETECSWREKKDF